MKMNFIQIDQTLDDVQKQEIGGVLLKYGGMINGDY
jgi:hypothetical protein